jgi:ABC-type transport system involved in multi-copper enzyme maturation permease subunit
MSSFWNEFRFSSRSVTLLIATVVLVALVFGAILEEVGHEYTAQPDAAIAYYYSGNDFHFLVYVYDSAGDPISGAKVVAQVGIAPTNMSGAGPEYSATGNTGTNGLDALDVAAPDQSVFASVTYTISGTTEIYPLSVGPLKPGVVQLDESMSIINLGTLASIPGVVALAAGPDGSQPTGYTVVETFYCPLAGIPCSGTANVTTTLGTMTSYAGVYRLEVRPPDVPFTDWLDISVRAPNDSVVDDQSFIGSGLPGPAFTPPAPSAALLAVGTSPQFLIWPAIGVVIGVIAHGRSRASGYLEGTMARPTTRTEVISAHFSAGALWAGIPVLGGVATLQATVLAEFHLVYPLLPLALMGGAIWASSLAWMGLTFLASHLSRSIIITGVLPLILVLFSTIGWQTVAPAVEAAYGVSLATPGVFAVSLVNPSQLPSLMAYAAAPSVTRVLLHALPLGVYGALFVGLACLVWAAGPIAGSVLLWLRRD